MESAEVLEELPIFPLATVLFPGAILPLHIFEDRYKEMMRYAIDHNGIFGLSYRNDAFIDRETPPEIGSVGCIAKISAVMPLEEGKMNLISTGVMRYRVLEFNQRLPFLIARVETFSDDIEPMDELNEMLDDITEMCKRFLEAAQILNEATAVLNQDLPEDPEAFSLIISAALPIDNEAKQALLEMTSTKQRLTRLKYYVSVALNNYTDRIKIQERARGNGHGRISKK
ncbi:MAG TPA: LON peptidase substrate-binding domain-containing protein [Blastocatellia bacterium]|nr:LON peptidase substrate-binding domain-containing protein [Blastocatellia bacterium]